MVFPSEAEWHDVPLDNKYAMQFSIRPGPLSNPNEMVSMPQSPVSYRSEPSVVHPVNQRSKGVVSDLLDILLSPRKY